jgi:Icc-related predicted phosphoesterase
LKILHLTDIHSGFEELRKVIETIKFDLALISGDITHFGGKNELQKALQILDNIGCKYYFVTGNCDKPECEVFLNNQNVSLDSSVVDYNSFQIAGLSGSLPCPGTTPNENSEEEYAVKLKLIESQLNPDKPLIFVTHQPPYKTLNDKVLLGLHVGSKTIREFIEKQSPLMCLTGHIHEGKGVDYIGKCPIINPGPLRNGHYAIIEITGESSPLIELY